MKTVGRYELLDPIGYGGMAVVYLAHQTDLDRRVALKELRVFQSPDDPALAERFLREARMAGSMSHPNIVTVHEYFKHEGTPYIAMEYLERGSLRPWVGQMTVAQTAGVLEGLLAALDHAERNGVVHRDLKPENLLVTDQGQVKVADFGIAKARTMNTNSFLTAVGTTVGTPTYMAPEQAMAQELGPYTDLYSVGVMAYEMFVGRAPFGETETPMAIILRHVNEQIAPAYTVSPNIDRALSDWIDKLLIKDPSQRVQSAEAAWDELEPIVLRLLGSRWRREARLVTTSQQPVARPLTPAPFKATEHETPVPVAPSDDFDSFAWGPAVDEAPDPRPVSAQAPPPQPVSAQAPPPAAPEVAPPAPGPRSPEPVAEPAPPPPAPREPEPDPDFVTFAKMGPVADPVTPAPQPAEPVARAQPAPPPRVPEPSAPAAQPSGFVKPPAASPAPSEPDGDSAFRTFMPQTPGRAVPEPLPPAKEPAAAPPAPAPPAPAAKQSAATAPSPPSPAAATPQPPPPPARTPPPPPPAAAKPAPPGTPTRTPPAAAPRSPEPAPAYATAETDLDARTMMPDAVHKPVSPPVRKGEPKAPTPEVGRRRRGALIGGGVGVLVLVVVGVMLAGGGDPKSSSSGGAATGKTFAVQTADLALTVPAPWKKSAAVPAVAGFASDDAKVAAVQQGADVYLAAELIPGPADPSLLPRKLLTALEDGSPDPEQVTLAGVKAYRYDALQLKDADATLHVYAVMTNTGVATLVCSAPVAKVATVQPGCNAIAGSLKLLSAQAVPVGPSESYAAILDESFSALDKRIKELNTRLGKAKTKKAQLALMRQYKSAYAQARDKLSGGTGKSSEDFVAGLNPVDAGLTARLTAVLTTFTKGYTQLERAVQKGDASSRKAALRALKRADGQVSAAASALRDTGYEPSGVQAPRTTLPSQSKPSPPPPPPPPVVGPPPPPVVAPPPPVVAPPPPVVAPPPPVVAPPPPPPIGGGGGGGGG